MGIQIYNAQRLGGLTADKYAQRAIFADATARAAAVPAYEGQLGVQQSDGSLWIADGLVAGAWASAVPSTPGLNSVLAAGHTSTNPASVGSLNVVTYAGGTAEVGAALTALAAAASTYVLLAITNTQNVGPLALHDHSGALALDTDSRTLASGAAGHNWIATSAYFITQGTLAFGSATSGVNIDALGNANLASVNIADGNIVLNADGSLTVAGGYFTSDAGGNLDAQSLTLASYRSGTSDIGAGLAALLTASTNVLAAALGGTGINNGTHTATLGGSFVVSGANTVTLAAGTASGTATLPSGSGTLQYQGAAANAGTNGVSGGAGIFSTVQISGTSVNWIGRFNSGTYSATVGSLVSTGTMSCDAGQIFSDGFGGLITQYFYTAGGTYGIDNSGVVSCESVTFGSIGVVIGQKVNATVSLKTTQYIPITIGATTYKVLTAN